MDISKADTSLQASKTIPAEGKGKEVEAPPLERAVSDTPYSIFGPAMKMWIIVLVSVSALISPFAATTYYPALNVLSEVLDITPTMVNVSITTYMIAQAIAPAIIGGMSDTSGRRLSFIVCFVIFIVANIGLALQTNYAALLILRMVQAVGCSAAIALSVAVVADLATSAERGKFMGYATAGILFGPAFGPTIGGVLAQYLGWRSIFYFLAIYGAVLLVIFAFFFPETCRNVVGNGSVPAKGVNRSIISYIQDRKKARTVQQDSESAQPTVQIEWRKFIFPNPIRTLRILGEKESCIVLLYNGLFFTGMMMITAAMPDLFKTHYGLDELKVGLCYISMGTGSLISALTMGPLVDWNFRRHAARLNMSISTGKQQDLRNFPIERVRLEVVAPGHAIGTLALIAFGWTVKFETYIAWPEVALFFIGFGVSTAFNITNTLLIDLHRDQPATATAAVNFVRCLMSAGGSVAIIPMCQAMNPGWAFTFLGLVYVVLIFVVFWVMRDGMKWRQQAEEAKREIAAAKSTA
ncbi:major facilitator superfamily domain-containing protein [Dendryphion nanum]|uniref:Major facilitator superfamily domain-containing protein n=1 Tax=Dendryphion nanum TaxID=256645 RepID=A0A9P9CYN8_9PLEO|nr:major facilitator superfamily domain-containing protein [Dendryphion nanum]